MYIVYNVDFKGAGCFKDALTSSTTYGCKTCQDSDPCSNYPRSCDPNTMYSCENVYGDQYTCQTAEFYSASNSLSTCDYCVCRSDLGFCSSSNDCAVLANEQCIGADSDNDKCGECMAPTSEPTTAVPTTGSCENECSSSDELSVYIFCFSLFVIF